MKRLLCIAALALLGMPSVGAEPIPDAHKTNGFALGCQAYSFRLFTMFEAIEKTAASGAKVIEFYPGQKFSPENPIGFKPWAQTTRPVKTTLAGWGKLRVFRKEALGWTRTVSVELRQPGGSGWLNNGVRVG